MPKNRKKIVLEMRFWFIANREVFQRFCDVVSWYSGKVLGVGLQKGLVSGWWCQWKVDADCQCDGMDEGIGGTFW